MKSCQNSSICNCNLNNRVSTQVNKGVRNLKKSQNNQTDNEQESIIDPSLSEQDKLYLKAVEEGDMETAQKMVDEAARDAGYSIGPVYHSTSSEFSVFDKSHDPSRGWWFSDRNLQNRIGATKSIRAFLKGPSQHWQRGEASLKSEFARNGDDWLDFDANIISTPDKEYGGTSYLVQYADDIKSADPVTYDDAGNIIPLSKRFNPSNPDIRSRRNKSSFNLKIAKSVISQNKEREKFVVENIKVIKNPTPEDYQQISKEFKALYPNAPDGTPRVRFTYDAYGNRYIWAASDAVHYEIEPLISRHIGTKVSQNIEDVKPEYYPQFSNETEDITAFKNRKGEYVEILHNPNLRDMQRMLEEQPYGDEIGIIVTHSNVYAFRRDLEFHSNAAREIGLIGTEYIGVLYHPPTPHSQYTYAMITDATTEGFRNSKAAVNLVSKVLPNLDTSDISAFNEAIVGPWQNLDKKVHAVKSIFNLMRFSQQKESDPGNNDNEEELIIDPSLSEQDKLYLKAVEEGDMETAQRMVDDAARAAGMELLYRGGVAIGEMQDGRTVWLSTSKDVAGVNAGDPARWWRIKGLGGNPESVIPIQRVAVDIKNPFIVDAKGSSWLDIPTPPEMNDEVRISTIDTDNIADWAKLHGYDGTVIKNVIEGKGASVQADTIAAFNPSSIKSADPLTYDDAGNIIPLSKRFNPSNPGIRSHRNKGNLALKTFNLNKYRQIKLAQIWTIKPEEEEKELLIGNFANNLRAVYELEYKWSMLQTHSFFGNIERKENIIKKIESIMIPKLDVIKALLVDVMENWLSNHALDDPDEWSRKRVTDESFSDQLENFLREYYKYNFDEADFAIFTHSTDHKDGLASVINNSWHLPSFQKLITAFSEAHKRDLLDGIRFNYNYEILGNQFSTEEEAIAALDNVELLEDEVRETVRESIYNDEFGSFLDDLIENTNLDPNIKNEIIYDLNKNFVFAS